MEFSCLYHISINGLEIVELNDLTIIDEILSGKNIINKCFVIFIFLVIGSVHEAQTEEGRLKEDLRRQKIPLVQLQNVGILNY